MNLETYKPLPTEQDPKAEQIPAAEENLAAANPEKEGVSPEKFRGDWLREQRTRLGETFGSSQNQSQWPRQMLQKFSGLGYKASAKLADLANNPIVRHMQHDFPDSPEDVMKIGVMVALSVALPLLQQYRQVKGY